MSSLPHHLTSLSRLWVGGWPVRLATTLPEGELLRQMWSGETAGGAEIVRIGSRTFEMRPPASGAPYRAGPLSAVVRLQVKSWEHGAMLEGRASLTVFPRAVIWLMLLALASFAGAEMVARNPVQALTLIGVGISILELVHYAARLGVERAMAALGASVGVGGKAGSTDSVR
jgi:hypothetical protein